MPNAKVPGLLKSISMSISDGFESAAKIAGISLIADSLMKSIDIQEKAYSLNLSMKGLVAKQGKLLEDLPGGFAANIGPYLEAKLAGLSNINKSTLKLISAMKATGEWSQGVGSNLANVEFALGLNDKQMSSLAQSILDGAETQKVSMGTLVNSIAKLSERMTTLRSLPGMAHLQEGVVQLSTKLGLNAKGVEATTNLLNELLQGKSAGQVAALGIGAEMVTLLNSQGPKASAAAIESIFKKGALKVEDSKALTQGNIFAPMVLETFENVYGGITRMQAILESSDLKLTKQERNFGRFHNVVSSLKDKILSPFVIKVTSWGERVISLLGNSGILGSFVSFATDFAGIFLAFKVLKFFLKKANIWIFAAMGIWELMKSFWKSNKDFRVWVKRQWMVLLGAITNLANYLIKQESMFASLGKAWIDMLADQGKKKTLEVETIETDEIVSRTSPQITSDLSQGIIQDALQNIVFGLGGGPDEMLSTLKGIANSSRVTAAATMVTSRKKPAASNVGGF